MCGITGVYAFNEKGQCYFNRVDASVKTLLQRGPDSHAVYEGAHACLGHARLSIIDLSDAASQPFQDVTKRYTIVFNGEIYNYQELRTYLIKKGLPLKTQSDTEVLLYLYIIEGSKCLDKLRGFFAFAVYDNRDNTFFMARDRIGIKPLLYYRDRNKLLFASEMKALMALDIPKQLDKTSASQYFQFNYIPSPHTIFEQVKKLEPGHFIFIENKQVRHEKYFTINYNRSNFLPITYDDAQVQLQKYMEQSVQERMIADVPLGAFLSGGIDSSVIVSEAVKFTDQLNTFSIGYKDQPFFDETYYAELVAKKFNTNHQTFSLSTDDLYANLHQVLEYIDEPFADSSALPLHILSMHTRNHATVALSGDGADELFSGYNKHKAHYHAMHQGFKSMLIKMGLPLWKNLPKSRNGKFSNTIRQLDRYGHGLVMDSPNRYWYWASLLHQDDANELFRFQVLLNELKVRKHEILKHFPKTENFSDILFTDMQLVLVSDMLHKVDSMSMANSLEVRVPFLDHRLVNFVFSLPDSFKINANMRKRLLQDTYRNILPHELYQRPKHGFEVPLMNWFRTELKDELLNKYLNRDFIEAQQIFNPEIIERYKKQLFSKNPGDIQAYLWALLVFQHWWIKNMD
ncbi:MAG: asparagine synthase (glutamine-hydrolyzing) [Bacteroidetes bacterium HGW-Bacteroidetes-4]|jgi:asparagine synthase (glutamine-hydrolysing)|nr:MAG: asparagine synthase (glutamine-hydrolyzing) [Bacteroidetes bacterium HGW-Bacteroidetes-4]